MSTAADNRTEEDKWFDEKYPEATCEGCGNGVEGATVKFCGGMGGCCETWFCEDCYEGEGCCTACRRYEAEQENKALKEKIKGLEALVAVKEREIAYWKEHREPNLLSSIELLAKARELEQEHWKKHDEKQERLLNAAHASTELFMAMMRTEREERKRLEALCAAAGIDTKK